MKDPNRLQHRKEGAYSDRDDMVSGRERDLTAGPFVKFKISCEKECHRERQPPVRNVPRSQSARADYALVHERMTHLEEMMIGPFDITHRSTMNLTLFVHMDF